MSDNGYHLTHGYCVYGWCLDTGHLSIQFNSKKIIQGDYSKKENKKKIKKSEWMNEWMNEERKK